MTDRRSQLRSLLAVLALAGASRGESRAEGVEPRPPAGHTAASVSGAPRPDAASGVAIPAEPGARPYLWIPRALLLLPRLAVEATSAPIRGVLWLHGRHEGVARGTGLLFRREGTSLLPIAYHQTGFGPGAGLRLAHRDLAGEGEAARAEAAVGGRFVPRLSARIDSGRRLGDRLSLQISAGLERRPRERFFGIGNLDEVEDPAQVRDADPDVTAAPSRFRESDLRVAAAARGRLDRRFHVRLTAAYLHRDFAGFRRGGAFERQRSIDLLYQEEDLVGFERGLRSLYGELSVSLDAREDASRWVPEPVTTSGWLARGFAGAAGSAGGEPVRYLRSGLDLERTIRISAGLRFLVLRAAFEGVLGDRDEIGFTELPQLGGWLRLRGYEEGRFRDRASALYTAEYQFGLNRYIAGYLFSDLGRVFGSIGRAVGTLDGYRLGFGGGLRFYSDAWALGRLMVSSSIDGGLQVYVSLDPVGDPRLRETGR